MSDLEDELLSELSQSSATIQKQQRVTKEVVGTYTVTTRPCIGSGTFGRVCEAEHNETHIKVAVKEILISHKGQRNDEMTRMAARELRILRKLKNHDNIVQILECVIEEDTYWIFMEYCDLGDLKAYLENNKAITFMSKVQVMHQSASAVAFMHSQEPPIIHRDIKLENIMMTKHDGHDTVKVTDFGLSKLCVRDGKDASMSAVFQGKFMTTACGSQFFLAPEFFAERSDGLKYDKSIDIFALGLVFLVLLDYGEDYLGTLPLSLSAKREKVIVEIGNEMIDCYRKSEPLPKLVENDIKDDEFIQRIKRIITYMTQFKSGERKNIQEVDQEFREIVAHLNRSEVQTHDMRRKEKEVTRIEQRLKQNEEEMNRYEQEIMRQEEQINRKEQEILENGERIRRNEQEMSGKDDQLRGKDDEIRQNLATIQRQKEREIEIMQQNENIINKKNEEIEQLTQMSAQHTINAASNSEHKDKSHSQQIKAAHKDEGTITGQPSSLVSKSFTRAKDVDLPSYPNSVHLIDDKIWYCTYEEIYIHSKKLRRLRSITLVDWGFIHSVAALADGKVVVAADKKLSVITKEGKKHRNINDGRHSDVCTHAELLYTICMGKSRAAIHVYSTHTWQQTRVIDHPCESISHYHAMRVNSYNIELSCNISHCMYQLTMDGKHSKKYNRKGSDIGEFRYPRICTSNTEDCLLVVDEYNDRLQVRRGRQWSVLQLQPQVVRPRGAVYDGHSLYVVPGQSGVPPHLSLYT